jgi:phosphoglycerol transferase MdoB-like AlkP superfamily enzyme
VPYTRILDNPVTNAFAYLDHCIGDFITKFKQTEAWDNSLVIFIPDHGNSHGLAEDIMQVEKNHVPLIMVGGALKGAEVIDVVCNQSDLAATLLGQLGIHHEDFRMSRDVLSETYTLPFAMNSWSQGIVMTDATGSTVYDLNTDKVSTTLNAPPASHTESIRAYLQQSYTLLSN